MDPYTFTLVLGGAGLLAMAATGLAHSTGQPGAHAGGHTAGHGGGIHSHGAHAAGHAGPHVPVNASVHASGDLKSTLLSLASPRALFSLLIGFGLTGIVLRPVASGVALFAIAAGGAVVFERALVRPLWDFLFRFASNPAVTLEGSVMSEGHAASSFDDNGQGLVAIEVDGQVVQCLGTLQADDRALGVRVHAGDVVRVEDVDPVRNRCTVSFVGRRPIS